MRVGLMLFEVSGYLLMIKKVFILLVEVLFIIEKGFIFDFVLMMFFKLIEVLVVFFFVFVYFNLKLFLCFIFMFILCKICMIFIKIFCGGLVESVDWLIRLVCMWILDLLKVNVEVDCVWIVVGGDCCVEELIVGVVVVVGWGGVIIIEGVVVVVLMGCGKIGDLVGVVFVVFFWLVVELIFFFVLLVFFWEIVDVWVDFCVLFVGEVILLICINDDWEFDLMIGDLGLGNVFFINVLWWN